MTERADVPVGGPVSGSAGGPATGRYASRWVAGCAAVVLAAGLFLRYRQVAESTDGARGRTAAWVSVAVFGVALLLTLVALVPPVRRSGAAVVFGLLTVAWVLLVVALIIGIVARGFGTAVGGAGFLNLLVLGWAVNQARRDVEAAEAAEAGGAEEAGAAQGAPPGR